MIAFLPLAGARWIGRRIGDLMWLFRTRAARTTLRNLELCFPTMSGQARKQLARESLRQTGCIPMEVGMLWHWPLARIGKCLVAVEGAERIDRNRPVVAIVPHFGNWEFVGFFLSGVSSLTGLYSDRRVGAFDRRLRQARQRYGGALVPANLAGIKALLKALQNKSLVAVLPDQVPAPGAGVLVDFYGQPALTATLVQRLLKGREADVVVVTSERVPGGFKIHIDAVVDDIRSADPVIAVRAMNAAVERAVDRNPAQYQWEYKRFRRAAERDPYRD